MEDQLVFCMTTYLSLFYRLINVAPM